MHVDEKIKRRLDELIATGEQVLATEQRRLGTSYSGRVKQKMIAINVV